MIGGLAREFYERLGDHYELEGAAWRFEPHVAEATFEAFIAEHAIPVFRDRWLDREGGVEVQDGRIVSITMRDGSTFRGRVFIDATYEGDLMAAAGVRYTVGRESNETYDETLNGVAKHQDRHHQFAAPVDPYVVPGDPASGVLPCISTDPPGEDGRGGARIQAYCFRMCLTRNAENRVPFPKPEGYDPARYELLLRTILAGANRHHAGFFTTTEMPNGKTDSNNAGPFSTDHIGANYEYPEASYERRAEIIEDHRRYQQGLMYFLANDPRVPASLRESTARWGLAKDEFVDNHHWPHQLYIREARRMVGDFVVTERHVRRHLPTPRPIGMGSYTMDSHHVQRYVTSEGHARNEGDVQVPPGGPYPIDFGAILPKRSECANLLVPVCVSASHIAFGSIRMEPVFMILGQSAAQAATLAIEHDWRGSGCCVRTVGARTARCGPGAGRVLTIRGDPMSGYIDGFILPVPKDRIDDYRKLAEVACAIWKEHGALEYRECVGDDLEHPPECGRGFPAALGAKDDETIMFSWAVFESREARDAANEKIYADPRLAKAMEDAGGDKGAIFDCSRMAYGGFRELVSG